MYKRQVPDYENLSDNYELLWDIPSNDGYLHLVGIMQKFVDQAISANTNYDPKRFEDGKVPMKVLLKDPVSYTHLDVYKRQPFIRNFQHKWKKACYLRKARFFALALCCMVFASLLAILLMSD